MPVRIKNNIAIYRDNVSVVIIIMWLYLLFFLYQQVGEY